MTQRDFRYNGTLSCASWPDVFAEGAPETTATEVLFLRENDDNAWNYIARQMAQGFGLALYGEVGDSWRRDEYVVITVDIDCRGERRTYVVDVSLHIDIDTVAGEARRVPKEGP